MSDPLDAFLPFGTRSIFESMAPPDKVITEQPHYCPGCEYFRDIEDAERPPKGALTPAMLEDPEGHALYGCHNPAAWHEPMPMRVIDIQLLRAVTCGSFRLREDQK